MRLGLGLILVGFIVWLVGLLGIIPIEITPTLTVCAVGVILMKLGALIFTAVALFLFVVFALMLAMGSTR